MSSITIYYPGLLGPDVPLSELMSTEWPDSKQTTNLAKLFSSAALFSSGSKFQPLAKLGIEARILECFGVSYPSENDLPVGYFRSAQHELSVDSIWCLDPVNIQIDRDEAVLVANESLCLEESEARSLIDALNQHFEQDDFQVLYHSQHQWLLLGDIELQTYSPGETMFRNISDYQPIGKDETKWRSFINEAQMLLHGHPVNEKRAEQGAAPANSLWVWGGGKCEAIAPSFDLVLSDELLAKDIASFTGIAYDALVSKIDPAYLSNKNLLVVCTEQMKAVRQNDVFGWFDHLLRFDKNVLTPLFELLQKGDLDSLTIKSDTVSILITKKDLKEHFWRFFSKENSFESGIKRLRAKYGC